MDRYSDEAIEAEQMRAQRVHMKVISMRPSVRARYDAAKASGDWATVSELLGEDVGVN